MYNAHGQQKRANTPAETKKSNETNHKYRAYQRVHCECASHRSATLVSQHTAQMADKNTNAINCKLKKENAFPDCGNHNAVLNIKNTLTVIGVRF